MYCTPLSPQGMLFASLPNQRRCLFVRWQPLTVWTVSVAELSKCLVGLIESWLKRRDLLTAALAHQHKVAWFIYVAKWPFVIGAHESWIHHIICILSEFLLKYYHHAMTSNPSWPSHVCKMHQAMHHSVLVLLDDEFDLLCQLPFVTAPWPSVVSKQDQVSNSGPKVACVHTPCQSDEGSFDNSRDDWVPSRSCQRLQK